MPFLEGTPGAHSLHRVEADSSARGVFGTKLRRERKARNSAP